MNNRCYLCAFCDWYMRPGTGKVFWLPAETGHTVDLVKAGHNEACIDWERANKNHDWQLLTETATPESIQAALDELRTPSDHRWKLSQAVKDWLLNKYKHAWVEFPSELVEGITFPLPEHLDNLPEYESHLSRTPEQVRAYIRLLAHNYTQGVS